MKEHLKTAVIILLLISVILLALTAHYYSSAAKTSPLARLAAFFGSGPVQPPLQDQEPVLSDASYPLLISVLGPTGRASFQGDFSAVDSAFDALGGYLAEALDTASTPESIQNTDFTAAAAKQGIFFRYPGSLPLSALAAWLDAETDAPLSASQLLLLPEQHSTALYLSGAEGCYRVSTEVDSHTLLTVLSEYPADGTVFAQETSDPVFARLDPLTLLDLSTRSIPAAKAIVPTDDAFRTAAASALGFNPYGDSSYRDDIGGTVYTESGCELRISSDGVLTLRCQDQRFSAASAGNNERIEYVRALLERLTLTLTDDSRLMLTEVLADESGLTLHFDRFLAGLPVLHSSGPAVTAIFSGPVLTELSFRIHAYTLDPSQRCSLLPPAQAAAVLSDGQALQLGYADTGESQLQAGWLQ